jgi:hypothetical protein
MLSDKRGVKGDKKESSVVTIKESPNSRFTIISNMAQLLNAVVLP